MNAIYLLIPLSILFLLLAMAVFLWAAKSKQFDDLDTPALSILLDDERSVSNNNKLHKPVNDNAAPSQLDATKQQSPASSTRL